MKWITDRFTFDKIFRIYLLEGYDNEEIIDIITNNYLLNTLVVQERIENEMYKDITINEEMKDLSDLKRAICIRAIFNKNYRWTDFRKH